MTDRLHALTVVLDAPIRDDDAQPLIDAIKQMKGVLDVTGHVANIDTYAAEGRARHEIYMRLWNHVKDPLP